MAARSTKSRKTAKAKPPDGRGRPAFDPTDEQRKTVKAMAGFGIPQEDIAAVLDVDPKTLRKHFRIELDTGETIATVKVAESLYNNATSGNVAAQIFWMKARAGWSEKHELGGFGGQPLMVQVVKPNPDTE